MWSACDSATSSAVTDPPAPLTAATRSPVARADAGASTRTVMAYPGLGVGMAGLSRDAGRDRPAGVALGQEGRSGAGTDHRTELGQLTGYVEVAGSGRQMQH